MRRHEKGGQIARLVECKETDVEDSKLPSLENLAQRRCFLLAIAKPFRLAPSAQSD